MVKAGFTASYHVIVQLFARRGAGCSCDGILYSSDV